MDGKTYRVPLVLNKTYLMRDGTKRNFPIYFAPFSGSLTRHLFARGPYSDLVVSWIDAAARDLIARGGGIVGVHFLDGKPADNIITRIGSHCNQLDGCQWEAPLHLHWRALWQAASGLCA